MLPDIQPGNTKILYFFNCLLDGMHTTPLLPKAMPGFGKSGNFLPLYCKNSPISSFFLLSSLFQCKGEYPGKGSPLHESICCTQIVCEFCLCFCSYGMVFSIRRQNVCNTDFFIRTVLLRLRSPLAIFQSMPDTAGSLRKESG